MADEFNTSFVDYSFVAFGGALGASFRFFLSTVLQHQKYLNFLGLPVFPTSTLMVNILGSLIVGCFYFFFRKGILGDESIRLFVVIGFLGSFTTFSTFSLETFVLLKQGDLSTAATYTFLSIFVCVLSTFLAFNTMRIFFGP